ncbi:MAG: hypothetical protein ACI977_000369 [Candidatus Nanohaloarchaea archaeon]|jgi:uncharacterized protein YqgC (DUF456 family)
MEPANLIILLLLIGGVIGSILPVVPGALLSLLATVVYIFTNPEPSLIYIFFSFIVTTFALGVDWLAGSVGAKYGGASNKTSLMAGLAGLIGFIFFGGPIGMVALTAATVYIREYLIHGDRELSGKGAVYATIAVLGSTIIQTFLTFTVLIVFLLTLIF